VTAGTSATSRQFISDCDSVASASRRDYASACFGGSRHSTPGGCVDDSPESDPLTMIDAQRGPLVIIRFVAMARHRFSLSGPALLRAGMLCAAVLLGTSPALAAWSVSDVAARLRNASDDRVRVQAALALGASMSAEAIPPLCDGLRDPSATVRGAAAAGLGRLRNSLALACLESEGKSENNPWVRAEIQRSIHRIRSVVASSKG
jgi:hypothetical protein